VIHVTKQKALKDVLPKIIKSGFSRVPVVDKDKVIGVLYAKDVLKTVFNKKSNINVQEIMHEPLLIDKKMLLDDLFRVFQKERPLIAIVMNKKKDLVLGIITMEDLLEEIVGEIYDESDI